jgi:hypothetical protein
MKRNLMTIAAAALLLGSAGAQASDVTVDLDYVGYFEIVSTPNCDTGAGFVCTPIYTLESGSYSITLPDDTRSTSTADYYGVGTDTISFETSGGVLVYYDEVRDLGGSEDSTYHLWLWQTGGGSIYYGFAGPWHSTILDRRFYYLPGTTPPASIPEPSQALMLALGLTLLAARRGSSKQRKARARR